MSNSPSILTGGLPLFDSEDLDDMLEDEDDEELVSVVADVVVVVVDVDVVVVEEPVVDDVAEEVDDAATEEGDGTIDFSSLDGSSMLIPKTLVSSDPIAKEAVIIIRLQLLSFIF